MLHQCPACGITREDMDVRVAASVVICPECGNERTFVPSPLSKISSAVETRRYHSL